MIPLEKIKQICLQTIYQMGEIDDPDKATPETLFMYEKIREIYKICGEKGANMQIERCPICQGQAKVEYEWIDVGVTQKQLEAFSIVKCLKCGNKGNYHLLTERAITEWNKMSHLLPVDMMTWTTMDEDKAEVE